MPHFRPLVLGSALALSAVGCGGGGPAVDPQAAVAKQANATLEAMKQLAEAIDNKDASGIAAAVEGVTVMSIDAKAQPEAAKAVLELYKSKVKGKLKGDQAAQVQGVMDNLERALK